MIKVKITKAQFERFFEIVDKPVSDLFENTELPKPEIDEAIRIDTKSPSVTKEEVLSCPFMEDDFRSYLTEEGLSSRSIERYVYLVGNYYNNNFNYKNHNLDIALKKYFKMFDVDGVEIRERTKKVFKCVVCGKEFYARRRAKYCSKACTQVVENKVNAIKKQQDKLNAELKIIKGVVND